MPGIDKIEQILRNCVHCGFCNATCPTYLETGDERDGPRGRIYLVKQLLESGSATGLSRAHLDRCLTCRACETTCPSGVEYARLADFGRAVMEDELPRSPGDRWLRALLRWTVPYRRRFSLLLAAGRGVRFLLPAGLKRKIPPRQETLAVPGAVQSRSVVLLQGCAQQAATPNTNQAASRVLGRLGIGTLQPPAAGCCGETDVLTDLLR